MRFVERQHGLERRIIRVPQAVFLAGILSLVVVAGCGGSAPIVEFLSLPDQVLGGGSSSSQVIGGTVFDLKYVIGAIEPGSTVDFVADVDGDLATLSDQVGIVAGLPVTNGAPELFPWNTAGVPPAVYSVVAVVHFPSGGSATQVSVERLTIATFTFGDVRNPQTALAGAMFPIDYTDNYPGAAATTDLYADRDGNLETTDDQILLVEGRVDQDGAPQQFVWDTTGVAPGGYFILAVFSFEDFTAVISSAEVTVNAVVQFLPGDAVTLPSTAYNVRVRFAASLATATINSATVPVFVDGAQVPGVYSIENETDVVFTPDSCVFPAPAAVRTEVWTSIGLLADPPAALTSATFQTSVSRVYAAPRPGAPPGQNVISVVDPVGEVQVDTILLSAGDATWFSTGASDGTIYFSSRGGAEDGYLIVVDTNTNTIADRVSLTKIDPFAVLFIASVVLSPDETELYCAVFEGTDPSDTAAVKFLVVLDRATLTEIGRVPLRGNPEGPGRGRLRGIAVTPDGRRAFVPAHDESAIHVVDLVARTEIDTDGIAANGITPMPTSTSRPSGVALNNDGSRLYVGHSGGQGLHISVFNTASLTETTAILSMAVVGKSTGPDLAFNPCDLRLYAGRVQLDSEADRAISVFDPGTATELAGVLAPGNGFTGFRNIAFVWGTDIAASGSTVTDSVILFDTTNLSADATSVTVTAESAHTVATIPPVRN